MIDPKLIAILVFIVVPSLFFGLGLLAAWIAWRKGYRPWFWLLSLGPIGTLSMLLRPNLNRATTPEEREQWERRADWTGGILSGITLFFTLAMPLVGMLFFFSFRAVAVAPAPATIAVPATSVQDEPVEIPVLDPQVSPVDALDALKPNEPGESSSQENQG